MDAGRSTRAVEGSLGYSLEERYGKLEEPRMTAAVKPARSTFPQRETSKLGKSLGWAD